MRFHHHHVWELGRAWWYVRSLPGELSLLPKLGVDSVASAGYHTLGGFGLMPYGYLPCVPPREVHWAEMQWSHVLAWGWPTPISCLSVHPRPVHSCVTLPHPLWKRQCGSRWHWVVAENIGALVSAVYFKPLVCSRAESRTPLRKFCLFVFILIFKLYYKKLQRKTHNEINQLQRL